MPEMVPESPLDRLRWLVDGKPTPIQFEDLGGAFIPQFRFMALLPASALPASEAKRIETYFDAMFEALVPVRDLITAYSLTGVMSRAPTSDFSLEVQFSDPQVTDMVRRSLPAELSGSALAHQRRYGNTLIDRAEAQMFFRDKSPQEDSDLSPAHDAARMLESSTPSILFWRRGNRNVGTRGGPAPTRRDAADSGSSPIARTKTKENGRRRGHHDQRR